MTTKAELDHALYALRDVLTDQEYERIADRISSTTEDDS